MIADNKWRRVKIKLLTLSGAFRQHGIIYLEKICLEKWQQKLKVKDKTFQHKKSFIEIQIKLDRYW